MSGLLDNLALDHRRMKRLIFVLRAEIDKFHGDDSPDYDRLQTVLEYMSEYSDAWHHPAEDRAMGHLDLDRLDPDSRAAVEQVRNQHRELAQLTESLQRDVEAVLQGTVVPRGKIEDDANAYMSLQAEHIRVEDEVVFPLLREHLTPEQLEELDKAASTPDDPLFENREAERFERLYFDILEAEHSEHEDD